MNFLKLILKLVIYQVKRSFAVRVLYLFFLASILCMRKISHIFKGGSQLTHQTQNSAFAERRKMNVDDSILTNTNLRTHRQNLISLEETDKINSKYSLVLKTLKYIQSLNSDFFIKKSEFKERDSTKLSSYNKTLNLKCFILEKLKAMYNEGGYIFRVCQFLKDFFSDLRIFLNRNFLNIYYRVFKNKYVKAKLPKKSTRFSIFYNHILSEYNDVKLLWDKEYIEVFSTLNNFWFFKLMWGYYDVFKYLFFSLLLVARIIFFKILNIFFLKNFNLSIGVKKITIKIYYSKFKLWVTYLFSKTLLSSIRNFFSKLKLKNLRIETFFLMSSFFYKRKVASFIEKRTKAQVQLISINLAIAKDLKLRMERFSNIEFFIKKRRIEKSKTAQTLVNKEALLTENLMFIKSILEYTKNKYKKFNKIDFNKMVFLKKNITETTSNKKIEDDEFLQHLRRPKFQSFSSRYKDLSLITRRKLEFLNSFESFSKNKKINLTSVDLEKINVYQLEDDDEDSRTKKFFIKKIVKINFYDFFNKSDKILNFYKKYGSLKKFKNDFLVGKKTYMNYLFFLKYFIIKRERLWNTAAYLMSGSQVNFKKVALMLEENFLTCYRFVQKYNSKLSFNTEALQINSLEMKNILIAAETFDIQEYCYRLFLKNIIIFLIITFLISFGFFFYIFDLNFFLSILLGLSNSFFLTNLYVPILVKFYKHRFNLFLKSITQFYKNPKSYNRIGLFFASVISSMDELLVFFDNFFIFDLIVYIKLKKFDLSFSSNHHKTSIYFEILKQSSLFILFLGLYIFALSLISDFFHLNDKFFIFNLIIIKIFSMFLFLLYRVIKFFLLFKAIQNEKSLVWKYIMFSGFPFENVYLKFNDRINFFFKKIYPEKNIGLKDFLFPVEKLNLSQKDIDFLKEFLKIEVNLETKSLKKLVTLVELKKKDSFKKP